MNKFKLILRDIEKNDGDLWHCARFQLFTDKGETKINEWATTNELDEFDCVERFESLIKHSEESTRDIINLFDSNVPFKKILFEIHNRMDEVIKNNEINYDFSILENNCVIF